MPIYKTCNEQVLLATGRVANTEPLNLSAAGITNPAGLWGGGYITVDKYQNTATKGVYALGDVCGKVELTPMAIAAGRRLADRYLKHALLFLNIFLTLLHFHRCRIFWQTLWRHEGCTCGL